MHTRHIIFFALTLGCATAGEPDGARLQELLKRYPEADTNKDGTLSLEEAQAHARVIRRGKPAPPSGFQRLRSSR